VTLRRQAPLDDAASSSAAAAVLAEWYASHPVVRRFWAIEAVDAIRIVVTLEPTVDGDDTLPPWFAHSCSWAEELELRTRRKVSLEMTNEPWRFESTFARDIALITELSWRDPSTATG
jgi:hypothetical protein